MAVGLVVVGVVVVAKPAFPLPVPALAADVVAVLCAVAVAGPEFEPLAGLGGDGLAPLAEEGGFPGAGAAAAERGCGPVTSAMIR